MWAFGLIVCLMVHAQVLSVTLCTIKNCEEFKQQYIRYDFLWKQDLHKTLEVRPTQFIGEGTTVQLYHCVWSCG